MMHTASENFLCSIKRCNRENIHALPKFKWVFADIFFPFDVNSIRVACFFCRTRQGGKKPEIGLSKT